MFWESYKTSVVEKGRSEFPPGRSDRSVICIPEIFKVQMIENVGVYCASSSRIDEKYVEAAREMGRAIVNEGWNVVYGGGGTGLMGAVASAALETGGKVIGIRPAFISDLEGDQLGLTELIVTDTMHERVSLLMERSDAFVILPGSCGTLDEAVQAVTWKRLSLHNKAVVFFNQDGFFDPLLAMFERTMEQHFISSEFRNLYQSCAKVSAVVDALKNYKPPKPMFVPLSEEGSQDRSVPV